ncbi:hypothetical protein EHS25_003140 [Saitozyma podzolica]|uniref:3-methyl-2-oxobutanoate dehydrogenase (2-methylpropanoyl-transferring) n=1 Tax=Saitozyma podzolica TaxID=1890683 RepID=A0A427Y820_9TREE|nr:hypothetical protein EHS25_003140 [Saitozyma podzolica]
MRPQQLIPSIGRRCRPRLPIVLSPQRRNNSYTVSVDEPSDARPADPPAPRARSAPTPVPDEPTVEEPSLGKSDILLGTEEQALATPGLTFADGHGLRGPTGKGRQTRRMNLYQAIRDALGTALATNPKAIVYGEDVAFGGVFRCTMGLTEEFEQGIAGFGIGYASVGGCAIAEIQFGDYLVNEAAKLHYGSGGAYPLNGGSLTVRAPIMSVGHGGLYHSQSPEGFFLGAAGLKVVIPRSPIQAKGMILAAIRDPNPVIVFEPKILSRPDAVRAIQLLSNPPPSLAALLPAKLRPPNPAPSIQLIDLRTINPLPAAAVSEAVKKTGRVVIVHEAGKQGGVGNDLAGEIGRRAFEYLEAPIGLHAGAFDF